MHQPQHYPNQQQFGSAVAELEHVLSTPPADFGGSAPGTGVTNNDASVAHASLQALRDAGDPQFLFLRCIIELYDPQQPHLDQRQQQHQELLFHCITGCRHVILTRWQSFGVQFRQSVRDYFMVLGGSNRRDSQSDSQNTNPFSRTLSLAFYNASASFWKRQWNESRNKTVSATNSHCNPHAEQTLMESIQRQKNQQSSMPDLHDKEALFHYLQLLMSTIGPSMAASASYLLVLIGEFAGKSASNYNMPLEFHKSAHTSFEKEGWLDRSLQISMKALSQVVGMLDASAGSSADIASHEELALIVVQLTTEVIGWEFGTEAWDSGGFPHFDAKSLVRPPEQWRSVLIQPEFIKAIFNVHVMLLESSTLRTSFSEKLEHAIRQLLLLLTSLNGNIFQSQDERIVFASYLLDGILSLLSTLETTQQSSELLDILSMVSRLVINFKLSTLIQLPSMQSLLQGIASTGQYLLLENLKECEAVRGDAESMEHREWREEALGILLEGVVLLCGDPWLIHSSSEKPRKAAQAALALSLGPLYAEFVTTRTRMARLEETYLTAHETDLDDVREEIHAVDLEEEMTSLAVLGRLDLHASLKCLSGLFSQLIPQLQSLWDGNVGAVSAEAAGLLEESRLVTMYIGHLLTDENAGETPAIPVVIVLACQDNQMGTDAIIAAVQTLQNFAEFQASRIAVHPTDPRLSPLLGSCFLWFLNRWAPAYILPTDYVGSTNSSTITTSWSSNERVQQSVAFLVTLCLHYSCYWPLEAHVQEKVGQLILSLAKRCSNIRLAMVSTPSFREIVAYHCVTCGIRHSASYDEFEATVRAKVGNMHLSMEKVRGYHRLPYDAKGKLLTGFLVACSEHEDEASLSLLNDCLRAIQEAFFSLTAALSSKQLSPDNVDAMEMASLCVSLYGGVARAGDMVASERIPQFLTPSLVQLSALMQFYAEDLSICESLLRLFRDYAEQFIAILEAEPCLVLFQSSSDLLKSYSAHHCSSERIIAVHSIDEEQKYDDILCAIELLIQLGTKDFIDVGHSSGVNSNQVTDMIFLGLQQILPLMSRGLLQYPHLCTQFFSLVGFMLETYAEKLSQLPYDLFDALVESLLYGMSHHDASIAKSSLLGLAGIARAQLEYRVLDVHIVTSRNHDEALIEKCSRRLLMEVVFQNIIWDRIEPSGLALLPLAAIDLPRFGEVVQGITNQIPSENRQRLISSFEGLLKPDMMAKAASTGYEGRKNRILFKRDFESFCHEIHSFLIIK